MRTRKDLLKQWKDTQGMWDDHDFLNDEANGFMKMRWRRLNMRAADFCAGHARKLGRGIDLVDVGCAHADFYDWVKTSLNSYTGIEPSKVLLAKKISKGNSFTLLPGQAEKLPLKKECADVVLIKEVLDHCYDPQAVANEVFRVLRPGGRLVITLTNDRAWYKLLFPRWAGKVKAGQTDHLYFFEPETVRNHCRAAGFVCAGRADSHYLRLPGAVEKVLGALPDSIGFALIAATDAIGSMLGPGLGGSFWITPRKPGPGRSSKVHG